MKLIFGASRPKVLKIGAELIMWWEETNASHCYTKIEVVPGVSIVFQAIGSGTEFCNLEYFLKHNIPVCEKEIEVSRQAFDVLIERMVSKLKLRYSLLHLFGLFIKRFVQYVFKKIIKNPFKDSGKSAVCVELLCDVVDDANIKRIAEDPEDMGMWEAMVMLRNIEGKELLNG
jgi:hypothetical protein